MVSLWGDLMMGWKTDWRVGRTEGRRVEDLEIRQVKEVDLMATEVELQQ